MEEDACGIIGDGLTPQDDVAALVLLVPTHARGAEGENAWTPAKANTAAATMMVDPPLVVIIGTNVFSLALVVSLGTEEQRVLCFLLAGTLEIGKYLILNVFCCRSSSFHVIVIEND